MNRAPLRLTAAQALDLQSRIASTRSPAEILANPTERGSKDKTKYGNVRVVVNGIAFDSKAEARRWEYLLMLSKAKEITDLQRQTPYELIPAMVAPSGKKQRPTTYLADFTYRTKAGAFIVEDVKGAVTPEFRLKRKLMLHVHGIEIQEIRS
jgi:hypothetical protein